MEEIIRLEPVLSEKSSLALNQDNKYTFLVPTNINKIFLKQYFKKKYNVDVTDINTMIYLGKARSRGRIKGKDSDYKKAIICIKEGQEIKEYKDLF
jgi:large subunit ribosomal protein L23